MGGRPRAGRAPDAPGRVCFLVSAFVVTVGGQALAGGEESFAEIGVPPSNVERLTSFDEGWAMCLGDRPGTLVAVCRD